MNRPVSCGSRARKKSMIESHSLGWYLIGLLLGPTPGPLFGGIIIQCLGWRWVFWIITTVCSVNTLAGYFFLRKQKPQDEHDVESEGSEDFGHKYGYESEDVRPICLKAALALFQSPEIFSQPIVATMSIYL
ncbi:hypothetical protein P154DRAFT_579441 [Amniculicola lignicola CBS 123094]|uniref:Major facilitator superfamily (MFS) profile domain-containing protein n=1 Tax=Amniculicola lignicola CBS 123094 TaxID=1392246 RepID=A0A6A5W7G8_9PLEO|nr:hypothetical protein P154DRAFT_579441 [Amniculicola lignicola CBS 123094]